MIKNAAMKAMNSPAFMVTPEFDVVPRQRGMARRPLDLRALAILRQSLLVVVRARSSLRACIQKLALRNRLLIVSSRRELIRRPHRLSLAYIGSKRLHEMRHGFVQRIT